MNTMLTTIIRSLIDYPEKLNLVEVAGQDTVLFEVHADQSDLGKIIGKQGKNINAIRTLLNAVATKEGKRASLTVVEPTRG